MKTFYILFSLILLEQKWVTSGYCYLLSNCIPETTYLHFCLDFYSKGKVGCQEVYRLRTRLFAPSENTVLKHDQFDFDQLLKWYLRSITSITIPANNFMRFVVWHLGYTCWKLNSWVESSYVIPFLINLKWFDRSMMYQKNTSETLAFFCLAPMYCHMHCTLVVLENEPRVEITDWSLKYSTVVWSNLKRDKTNLKSIGKKVKNTFLVIFDPLLPYPCRRKLWIWYGIFQQKCDSKYPSPPPLPHIQIRRK